MLRLLPIFLLKQDIMMLDLTIIYRRKFTKICGIGEGDKGKIWGEGIKTEGFYCFLLSPEKFFGFRAVR